MKRYIATYKIETKPKHFEEHMERFPAGEDNLALEYTRTRLSALREEHKDCSSVSLVKLVEVRKVDIRSLTNRF